MAYTPTMWINLTGGPVKVKKVGGGVLEISASGHTVSLEERSRKPSDEVGGVVVTPQRWQFINGLPAVEPGKTYKHYIVPWQLREFVPRDRADVFWPEGIPDGTVVFASLGRYAP